MAEKFMTRRERRESERRAADAAYDAQQTAEAPEPEAPADAVDADAAPPESVEPPAPTEPPAPADPQTSAERPAAAQAPSASAADAIEVPRFSSRGERKRFLREHDLPSDISTAAIPTVLAQREAEASAPEEPEPTPAGGTPDPVAPAGTAPAGTASAPVVAGTPDDAPAPDEPAAGKPAPEEPSAEEPAPEAPVAADDVGAAAAAAAEQSEPAELSAPAERSSSEEPAPSASGTDDEGAPATSVATGAASATPDDAAQAGRAPAFDLARHRVDASPTGPDFETSSTAVIAPSALGDIEAPLRRRTPVVKPPTGSNIRVVTGALPIVTPEDLEENPPTTPLSAIDEDALGTGTFSTASRTSTGQTPVSTAARADVWHGAGAATADEEEDSDELEEPPVKPMSARSVTNEDGEILVAERNSMIPYIVLGAAGFVALALVVIALFLLL